MARYQLWLCSFYVDANGLRDFLPSAVDKMANRLDLRVELPYHLLTQEELELLRIEHLDSEINKEKRKC